MKFCRCLQTAAGVFFGCTVLLVLFGSWGSLLPMITPTLLGGLGVGFEQRAAYKLFYYLNTTWAWRFSYYPR